MSALEIESEWRPRVNPWVIAGSVMLATFMEVLDTTVVSVALPNMAGGLSSTNEEATWVLTSYLVANAIVLPASGWFSLRCGRKRFLMICTALFTLGSFLCGIAPSMPFLVLARMLQGAGGGTLQPLSQAILLESFPRKQHGMAMAAFGIGVVVAPIIGPLLGGWLTDNYSWRWMFYINIPIGLLSLYLMRQNLEDPPYIRESKPGSIDAVGFAFLIIWLSTLQIVLDKGQQEDWFASTWISWFSVISVSAMALLIVRELRTPEPIVDLRVFKNRNFWIGNLLMTIVSAVMYSAVAMVPLFVQTLLGYTAFSAGIATAPRGIGAMAAMPIVGKLMSHMDGKWLVMLGRAHGRFHAYVRECQPRHGHDPPRPAQHPSRIRHSPGHGSPDGHYRRDAAEGQDRQRQRHLQPDAQPRGEHRDFHFDDLSCAPGPGASGKPRRPYERARTDIPGAARSVSGGAFLGFRRPSSPGSGVCADEPHPAAAINAESICRYFCVDGAAGGALHSRSAVFEKGAGQGRCCAALKNGGFPRIFTDPFIFNP
jgi:EmrB/QacA subfamily drug resistance transporter